ncbi:hypothetical protein SB5439_04963 [Klebsiella variicola]|uniref:hypothetical protein n=1 Tax=Klebsiella variicola TaxID=244366 RepID=UPI00109D295D|nr:hypothetical protein [Klebsiella variicola]VGQ11532.1 hypothetical protein SB5439_04963 [Klebsiella variicola]
MSNLFKLFFIILYCGLIFVNALFASDNFKEHNYIAAFLSFVSCIIAIGGFHYFFKKILFYKPFNFSNSSTITIRIECTDSNSKHSLVLSNVRQKNNGTECIVNARRMALPLSIHAMAVTMASIGDQEGIREDLDRVLPQLLEIANKLHQKQTAERKPEDGAKTTIDG